MKKRTGMILLGIALATGMLCGCGGGSGEAVFCPAEPETGVAGGETEEISSGQPGSGTGSATPALENLFSTDVIGYGEWSDGVNGLTFAMFDALPREGDLVFSGYSIASALGMLELGAENLCKQELDAFLGIQDPGAWHAAMCHYIQKPWPDSAYVLTANMVWMDDAYPMQPNMQQDYGDWVEKYYLCRPKMLDLGEEGVKRINAWADEHTKGLIPQIVGELPADTVMVLTNAVYFNGKWSTPFDPECTRQDVFHGQAGDTTRETMHLYGERFGYQETEDFYCLCMDYKDSDLCMKIFLAKDESANSGELFAALTTEEKKDLLHGLDLAENHEEIHHLQLPSWTCETSLEDTRGLFAGLGLEKCFDKEYAAGTGGDFNRIGEYLAISDILHKAKIIVAEEGTEAAAVTAVMVDACSAIKPEPVLIDFIADRPFVYVIQDRETGVILFMGVENE